VAETQELKSHLPGTDSSHRPAQVVAVQDSLVTIEAGHSGGRDLPLVKNEMAYILPQRRAADERQERLEAEVLRVRGREADLQVFEDTSGVAVGDPVEQTGELLSVELGPGLLGQVYDGLQNPLEDLASAYGMFLPRGVDLNALERNRKWSFAPKVETGARLKAGGVLGTVQEGHLIHRIMLPFDEPGEVEVTWIQEGSVTVDTPVARIRGANGEERSLSMLRRWPVRRPLPEQMLRTSIAERRFPHEPMVTSIRLVDTFFPVARGGAGCIPGPFGAGKTVLQQLLARYATVDVVILVACGERAGEVVETLTELPRLKDPRTGGSLMDRTIIICNTSSMPVAAREASIYTGITLGEYYRQMGCHVLLLADSTSRWAQAMRETSGRLEEIPGEEAFPAYLDSAIRAVYERAGVIATQATGEGSLTLIGTVSPAGGNFEEPVTQSTLGTVKAFLGLSYDRAYRRFYPAVDPLISWSRYLVELSDWFDSHMGEGWVERVQAMQGILEQGDAVAQMMQVTGEEGVTLEDFVLQQKALFLDMVYLQQDAFDEVDASVPLERQKMLFDRICAILTRDYRFDDKDEARDYFTRLTGLYKNLNYAATDSPEYRRLLEDVESLASQQRSRGD
jgi:V/A-type H+-transporting ATPase subunit A